MTGRYWGGNGWYDIPAGDGLRYWNGSAYVVASRGRYWGGNGWYDFWTKSDPITVHFYPTFTTNLRRTGGAPEYDAIQSSGNNAAANLVIGRYGGTHPYHYTGLVHFQGNSVEGIGSLTDLMIARPVVKAASLRLTRAYGGLTSPAGVIRIGTWTQAFAQTLPATTLDGTYHDWDPQAVYDITGWVHGQTRTFGLHTQTIYDLQYGKSIMVSEVTGGYNDPGGTTSAYGAIWGLANADGNVVPYLTVILDVA